jgi:23S rRNA (guanosine2251-2'-O)-methyltransferase
VPGNSERRGAVRKSRKGNPTAGSGGRRRKALEGKGPTPKAKDRPGHKVHRTAKAAARQRPPRHGRASSSAEWVVGRNAVVEALREGVPVTSMYVAEATERDARLREAYTAAAERRLSVLEVSRVELDRITGGLVHQGVALKVPPYDYAHPDDLLQQAEELGEKPLVVMLDGITDPRNLGAVVRSAAAFGAHGVVIPERRAAAMTASAWKTSAGAAARVAVARTVNLARQLRAYRDAGLTVAGLTAEGSVSLGSLDGAEDGLVLVIGSEGKGLGRLVRENCDVLVSIPISHDTESLNASVAAGVALYEVSRRRRA